MSPPNHLTPLPLKVGSHYPGSAFPEPMEKNKVGGPPRGSDGFKRFPHFRPVSENHGKGTAPWRDVAEASLGMSKTQFVFLVSFFGFWGFPIF